MSSRSGSLILIGFTLACVGTAQERARDTVASSLSQALGAAADPQIAFQRDSGHLLVQLSTRAFPTMSEDAVTSHADRVARIALREYSGRDGLDSITVLYRERFDRDKWWIRNTRTFAASSLRNDRSKSEPVAPKPPTTR